MSMWILRPSDPSVLFERLAKYSYARLQFRIGLSAVHQHANPPHPPCGCAALPAGTQPRCREGNEFPPPPDKSSFRPGMTSNNR
jgi:hypothetical protein